MLPSIARPLVAPPSPGAADPAPPPAGGAARTALAVLDTLGGATAPASVLHAPAAAKKPPKPPKPKATAAGYAKSAGPSKLPAKAAAAKATPAKRAGPLAFLDDKKLSVEEKLMRLLAYLNDRWEKDIEKTMKDLRGAAEAKPKAAPASSSKTKGVLGKLGGLGKAVGAAKAFFPGVGIALDVLRTPSARAVLSKIGGPVLAAAASATGFPQLAPLALRYGPALVDLAADVASSAGTASGSSAVHPEATSGGHGGPAQPAAAEPSGAATAAGKPGTAGLSSDRQAQLKLMEIQRIVDQQREMFSLVSNILRSGHDARMAVIQNVR